MSSPEPAPKKPTPSELDELPMGLVYEFVRKHGGEVVINAIDTLAKGSTKYGESLVIHAVLEDLMKMGKVVVFDPVSYTPSWKRGFYRVYIHRAFFGKTLLEALLRAYAGVLV